MTVHRPQLSDRQETSTRKYLGRVSVTIDDLDALVKMLSHDNESKVTIEFSGGHIDEAADMKILNDAELSEIRVKATSVEVVLSSYQAVAIGREDICEAINNQWARMRKTSEKPRLRTHYGEKSSQVFSLLMLATVTLSLGATILQSAGLRVPDIIGWGNAPLSVKWPLSIAFVLTAIFMVRSEFRAPWTYAVIKPWTLEDERSEGPANQRNKIAIAVATTSIVVATATAILVKII
ncbi:hypothetical protein [Saccharothrix saharensis]|uniref:hypothetical protein n=1 Tax=Saccharothrix saharensis TaxID=571190 RepID=UPI0011527EE4|nr:hypothetical protein [Saccharothrix saharensis]